MSGITVKALGPKLDHYVINKISEGSPASGADIQVGDEIIRLNGHLLRQMTLGEVNNYFRTKPGRKLKIAIVRDDEELTRKIRLERVI
jgi:C-terminal processing protease CtpA/Prc